MIRLKKGVLPDGRVFTPYALKDTENKWIEITSYYSNLHHSYNNLDKIRHSDRFKSLEDSSICYKLITRNYAFKVVSGVLLVSDYYTSYSDEIVALLCLEGTKLVGVINAEYFNKASSTVQTILRQFLRQHGVALKDIVFLDTNILMATFFKSVVYGLEDALPEEQKRISSMVIQQLLEKYTKEKQEECTESPF